MGNLTPSETPLRVLFMQSQTYYGADSRIHGLLMRHLAGSGVEVHAACNYGDGLQKSAAARALEEIPGLNIRPTNFGTTVYARSKGQIARDVVRNMIPAMYSLGTLPAYVRRNKIDIIHCTEKPRDAFFGYLLARATGAKCVIHLHVKAEGWIDPKVQWAMRNADALIGVSKFVADSIKEMGFPAEKTFFVHNSLDLDGWAADVDGRRVREEFRVGAGKPLLLIVSRLFYWKGHSELLKALALVKQDRPDFKLLIVGEDDPRAHPGRGRYSEELKTLAQELGLSDHVIFTGYRSDVRQLLAACDLFTMPSFEEPFGMVFLEAMAMKVPVIALDNGGSREVVEHNVTGLLSPPQDIDRLAMNVKTLIENSVLRRKMGERGRRRVEEYFTPLRLSQDVVDIYREILRNEKSTLPILGEEVL